MVDISELPPCRICGKALEEIPSWEAIIPLEVVLRVLPRAVHPSLLRHFECPDRHGGVVMIPKASDEEKTEASKNRNKAAVN